LENSLEENGYCATIFHDLPTPDSWADRGSQPEFKGLVMMFNGRTFVYLGFDLTYDLVFI